jgi:1-acyl-sn-glycerol-3-phosphate acyltransferase
MNLWRPQNDCGTDCLVTGDERTEAPKALQVLRFVRLLGALVVGALLVPILPLLPAKGVDRAGRGWARLTLAALGIQVRTRGRAPRGKALVVANHVSWLDIIALLVVTPGRMLAKVEVKGWPLFGALAASGGTIFVDRARPKTLPDTVADVAAALRSGAVVTVFPEGTTGCGASVGTFRPAMFQAAIDAGARIVPVTLRYGGPEASFIGDETLWESVRRVLALPKPVISVSVAPALHPEPAASRRALARVAQAAVGTPVFLPAPVEETEAPVPVPLALAA